MILPAAPQNSGQQLTFNLLVYVVYVCIYYAGVLAEIAKLRNTPSINEVQYARMQMRRIMIMSYFDSIHPLAQRFDKIRIYRGKFTREEVVYVCVES